MFQGIIYCFTLVALRNFQALWNGEFCDFSITIEVEETIDVDKFGL